MGHPCVVRYLSEKYTIVGRTPSLVVSLNVSQSLFYHTGAVKGGQVCEFSGRGERDLKLRLLQAPAAPGLQ